MFTKVMLGEKRGRGVVKLSSGGSYYCEVWNYVIIYVRHSGTLLYNILKYSKLQRSPKALKRERE